MPTEIKTIKDVVDKIILESNVRDDRYTVEHRLQDVNSTLLYLDEIMAQTGSDTPANSGNSFEEVFNNKPKEDKLILNRNTKYNYIEKVEFSTNGTDWYCLGKSKICTGSRCTGKTVLHSEWSADEHNVYINNSAAGDYRITYTTGKIKTYTLAEYNNGTTEPAEIPNVFRDLLWMRPAVRQAGYFKPERFKQISIEYNDLLILFKKRYLKSARKFVAGKLKIKKTKKF